MLTLQAILVCHNLTDEASSNLYPRLFPFLLISNSILWSSLELGLVEFCTLAGVRVFIYCTISSVMHSQERDDEILDDGAKEGSGDDGVLGVMF